MGSTRGVTLSNWAKLQEDTIGLPVYKRAKHGIHFDKGNGEVLANFVGRPCHYLDGGLWKPIDTKLLLAPDGSFGSPHSDVRIHPDGFVRVTGSDYKQFTELPSAKKGVLAGDRIIRTFPGGEQHLIMTEDGFRQEIRVDKPTFPLEKFIARQTGSLPSKYIASPLTAMDADGKSYVFTGNVAEFGAWLDKAKYPVVIDPDFAVSSTFFYGYGNNATYLTARSTNAGVSIQYLRAGQFLSGGNYAVLRGGIGFDTSSIGAGSTVTQVNLKMVVNENASSQDCDVQIVKCNWSSGTNDQKYDAILAGDADDSILFNTASYPGNNQPVTSGNLSTAWVSKTGVTYYGLRSDRDYAATQPSGNEYVGFHLPTHATESYRPVLTVTYTEAVTGAVKILPAIGLVGLGSGGVRIRPTGGIRL